jgi:hypothetical protein
LEKKIVNWVRPEKPEEKIEATGKAKLRGIVLNKIILPKTEKADNNAILAKGSSLLTGRASNLLQNKLELMREKGGKHVIIYSASS